MQNQLLFELYHRILHSELEILKQSNTTHHVTAFTDALHRLVTKISEIVKSTKQTSQALLRFIEKQLIFPGIEIQRHPKSGFLELLRLENQYIQFFTHICVRFMCLMYKCLLYHSSTLLTFKKQEQQFSFMIRQTKIQLMFQCQHSLDTLIVQFFEKFKSKQQSSSPYNLTFLEKAQQICLKHDLSYVDNWIQIQKQNLKEQWSQKHKAMLIERSQKKKTGETHRKSRVIVPKKNIVDEDKNTNKQKQVKMEKKEYTKTHENNHKKDNNQIMQQNEANRRLSLYVSEKKRRDSENHSRRTIHQERLKYTTKTYNQQIVYTYVNNQKQPIPKTPSPQSETQPQVPPYTQFPQTLPKSE